MTDTKKDKFDDALSILDQYNEGLPPRSSRFEASCLCGSEEHKKTDTSHKEKTQSQ